LIKGDKKKKGKIPPLPPLIKGGMEGGFKVVFKLSEKLVMVKKC